MDRYRYTVEWYNEYYDMNKEYGGQTQVDCGYVESESLVEAVTKLTKHYGDKEIDKLYIETETNDSVIVIKEDINDFDINWEGPAKNVGY